MDATVIPFGNGDFCLVPNGPRNAAGIFELACAITGATTPRLAGSTGDAPPVARPTTIDQACQEPAAVVGKGDAFPPELVALAADHVATARLLSTFDGLLDLIERVEDEAQRKGGAYSDLAGHMLDALVALRIETEDRIQRAAEKAAMAEAVELAETLADMDLDEQKAAFAALDAAQRQAVIWAQARALAERMSLTATIGETA